MKGKKKYIVPLLLAGVTATGMVAEVGQHQNIQVQAETTTEINQVNGAELRIKPFEKNTYDLNERVYLPTVTVANETTEHVKFTVKKGDKNIEILTDNDEGSEHRNEKYFVARYMGFYNITAEVFQEGRVVSKVDNLSVFVERSTEAVINLPINSRYVIPAKMQKGQDGFKIPAPTVTTTVDDKDVTKGYKDGLTTSELVVTLFTPSKEVDLSVKLDASKEYFSVDKTDLSETGTYQIVYEYKNGDVVISRLESNFQVVEKYKTEDIKLAISYLDDMPTVGNVNTDIKIPRIKVVDTSSSSTDSVNAYVEVTIKNVNDPSEVVKVNYEDYTFKPSKEGKYSVTYKASIPLFGENIKTNSITHADTIEVSDKKAPVVMPTYEYTFNEDGEIDTVNGKSVSPTTDEEAQQGITFRNKAEEMLVNRRVDIPSIAVLKTVDGKKSVTVDVPAAYATDNFYTYSNKNEDIVITRTYRTATGRVSTILDNEGNPVPANQKAQVEFTTKGNSEIRYQAKDKAGNTLGEIIYDIVIYDEGEETTEKLKKGETKIDLNVGTEIISYKEKKLTFAKPTAIDTFDKNVEVKTYYKYQEDGEKVVELTETNDNGEYEIDLTNGLSADQITIYAEAIVDKNLQDTRGTTQLNGTNIVRSEEIVVKLVKPDSDTEAPIFGMPSATWNEELFNVNKEKIANVDGKKISDEGYLLNVSSENITLPDSDKKVAPFDQGNTIITLPTVEFKDNYDANMTISVKITDKFGNDVSKVDQEIIEVTGEGPFTYSIKNASFKLSTYGVYTVTYTAKDVAGHVTVKSFGIRVNDKTAPTIIVDDEDKFGKEIEVGEYFKVPAARLIKNGENCKGTISWEIYKASSGAYYERQPNGFTPTTEGTYFIKYTAVDEFGNVAELQDSLFMITAKDTVAPTIELDMTERIVKAVKWAPEENNDYMVIEIPVAFATDKLTKKDIEVTYSVSGPNGSSPKVTDHESKDHMKTFKATSQGVYTVKYTAIDSANNKKEVIKTIEVGDCQAPELTWVDKDKNLPTEVKLNESYVLDLNKMIKLTDNVSTEAELLEKIEIKLISPDGQEVSSEVTQGNGYEWKFTKSGNYTLKITVKDKVGNSRTPYTYNINVPAEKPDENKVSPVLGTVLVVLSVVVLSGVVVYFVVSSKKKSGKKTSKKTNNK